MNFSLKRIIALILTVTLALGTTACGSKAKAEDQNTLTLTLGSQPWADLVVQSLEDHFPDIKFHVSYYTGANTSEYFKTQLEHDDSGDIFFGTLKLTDKKYTDRLVNLSGYDFTSNLEDSMLQQYDVDGAIYQLPCIVMLRTMAYNKTLFREKGWKVPQNHKQLVDLCKQIRRESDITPITFPGNNPGFYFTTLTTLAQTGFLSTRDGQAWEKSYIEGKTSCKQGFETGISMLQELIDADAYDIKTDEKIENFADAVQRMEKHEAAMAAMWGGQQDLITINETSSEDFGLFPFYSRDGQAMLGTNVNYNIGISSRLSEKGNEKKLENALRVLEWFTTEEGMSHLQNGESELLTAKGANNEKTAKLYSDVWETNLSGMKAPMLYVGYEDIMNDVGLLIKDAMLHKKDLSGLVPLADRIHQNALSDTKSASPGSSEKDMSHPETAQLLADALQSSGLADVTLISDGTKKGSVYNKLGAPGKIYSGKFSTINYSTALPQNYNLPVVVKKMTGAEIAALLENGVTVKDDVNGTDETANFDYYWSGMDVVFENGKVKTMTGTPPNSKKMDADDTFTVLFSAGDYPDAGTPSDRAVPQKKTFEEIFLAYLAENSPLKAPEVLRK